MNHSDFLVLSDYHVLASLLKKNLHTEIEMVDATPSSYRPSNPSSLAFLLLVQQVISRRNPPNSRYGTTWLDQRILTSIKSSAILSWNRLMIPSTAIDPSLTIWSWRSLLPNWNSFAKLAVSRHSASKKSSISPSLVWVIVICPTGACCQCECGH